MNTAYHIEEASPQDASLLSQIAQTSKMHWGYPAEWLELWLDDLTLTPELMAANSTWKILDGKETAGFTMICQIEDGFEIEHCFVLPQLIGKGCGSKLLNHVLALPQYRQQPFTVLADPNAVPFYTKFGFKTVKQVPSKPAGRTLPLMKMLNP